MGENYGGNKTNVNIKSEPGGSLEKGVSSSQKCPKGYVPRTSGEGDRPNPPIAEKTGVFTIK